MLFKEVVHYACTRSNSPACTHYRIAFRTTQKPHTTPRMTTQITRPNDDEAFPTTPSFNDIGTGKSTYAPLMFSPFSKAKMGQFDTEADQQ